MLSRTQAGPSRTVKQQQEHISPNHVQAIYGTSVDACRSCVYYFRMYCSLVHSHFPPFYTLLAESEMTTPLQMPDVSHRHLRLTCRMRAQVKKGRRSNGAKKRRLFPRCRIAKMAVWWREREGAFVKSQFLSRVLRSSLSHPYSVLSLSL